MRDFSQNAVIVIWEMTRACALKCVHCRAESADHRNPEELTTGEAFKLLREIKQFGEPIVVLTGGDPLRRPDLCDLVAFGTSIGLHIALTPSGTSYAHFETFARLKHFGLRRLAMSLDGPDAKVHDSFRQVEGSFGWSRDILTWADKLFLPFQINSTITRRNIDHFDELSRLIEELNPVLWSLFFLIPTGRAQAADQITAAECEKIFEKMFAFSRRTGIPVKTTEGMHYRRYLLQHAKPDERGRYATLGVNDGKGFVFISHTGEIYPSGFLPIPGGNVKKDSLLDVYRNAPVFLKIRDTKQLKGKCGRCEFNPICGGSRARAYGMTGDFMQEDPLCIYQPRAKRADEYAAVS